MLNGSTSLRDDAPTGDVLPQDKEYDVYDIVNFEPIHEDGVGELGDSDGSISSLSWTQQTTDEPSESAPGLLTTTSQSAATCQLTMNPVDPSPDPSVTEPQPLNQHKRAYSQLDCNPEKRTRMSNTTPSSDRDRAGDRCSAEAPTDLTAAVSPPRLASPGDAVDAKDVFGLSTVARVRAILQLFNPDSSACLVVDTTNSDSHLQRDESGDRLDGLTARYDTVVLISTGNPWSITVASTAAKQATLYNPRHDSQDQQQIFEESHKCRLGGILTGMGIAMDGDWDFQTYRRSDASPSEHAGLVEILASAVHNIHGRRRPENVPIEPWRTAIALAASLTDDTPIDALSVTADTDAGPSRPWGGIDGGRDEGVVDTHTQRISSLAQQINHALRICEACETIVDFVNRAEANEIRYLREVEGRCLERISSAVHRLGKEHMSGVNVHDAEIEVRGLHDLSVHIGRSRYTKARAELVQRIGKMRQSATGDLKCLRERHADLVAETKDILDKLDVIGKDIPKTPELRSLSVPPAE